MKLNFIKYNEEAIIPSRATPGAAGLDLYSTQTRLIHHGTVSVVPTGVGVEIPADHVGLIWPRSGLSAKNGIDVLAGVIDCDYRGEIKVVLTKTDLGYIRIKEGERIAQLVIQRYEHMQPSEINNLGETHRNSGGFGSTGD